MHGRRPTVSVIAADVARTIRPARSSRYLDTQYTALVQVELIGEDDRA